MPPINRKIASRRLYAMSELLKLRRRMLRFARSLPPGSERNDYAKLPTRCAGFLETRSGSPLIPQLK
jgi:hypothetical protein